MKISTLNTQLQNRDRLVIAELRKSFRTPGGAPLEVLRGVSFAVEPGEMLAVMGASGAGKSTLLHLIGGLEEANGGAVRLGDFDVTRSRSLARYRNEEVGFVFQFHHLLPDLTAEENVALPLSIGRARWRESHRLAALALASVGLSERASHTIGQLSGGEQQRVALARALIKRPRLVLADEPTGNLDAEQGERVGALLSSYCRAADAIVIVATHNSELARLCDRRLFLEEGRIREEAENQER